MTLKLALIGKGIGHSKSQLMYEKILKAPVDYTLIDCEGERDLPALDHLFGQFKGVSITAPYKKYYLDQVSISQEIASLYAINCLRRDGENYHATNTDYLALIEIFSNYLSFGVPFEMVILGGGSMAKVTESIFHKLGIPFHSLKRSEVGDLESFDLSSVLKGTGRPFFINACSRHFVFRGKVPRAAIFYDYNYSFSAHDHLVGQVDTYVDGIGLLYLQAKYALAFWGISI